MQPERTSDLFSEFGLKARLAQFRRLIQDAIDVWQGLVLSQPERYRRSEGAPTGPDPAVDPIVVLVEGDQAAPDVVSLPPVGHDALHA